MTLKKSDLIVISDGGFGYIPDDLERQMQNQRQKDNKFYLLDINGNSGKKTFFDKHWIYNAQTQNINTLYENLATMYS
ncbi:hypothetical protein C826_00611 [Helicobacter bilis WiWa]|uniref:Uncharacterized protein n=1 Tax=Helicobacter bilis WiWa TaxID=1235804 RepID=N2BG76_9HELI|nr:hypothetical protein [Helicobacter bilis]EMZ40777.1 hypothetical protein C826_00611 [Helicobacter bilis WiWa]